MGSNKPPSPTKRRMTRRSSATTIASLLLLAASILGVGPMAARAADSLNGEGESWPGPAFDAIRRDAAGATAPFGTAFIDAGETEGRGDLAHGASDFAVTSIALSNADKATATSNGRTIAYAPYMAGAVAPVVALDIDAAHGGGHIQHLSLKVSTMAKLFTHKIAVWNDAEIVAQNPAEPNLSNLKAPQVAFVARKDTSSSTAALISLFLSDPAAKAIWNDYAAFLGAPPDTPLDSWPSDANSNTFLVTSGSKGTVDKMLQLDPSTGNRIPSATSRFIGYLAPSWAIPHDIAMVTVLSSDGLQKIDPNTASVTKAMAKGTVDPATNIVTLKYGIEADGAWPAPLISYIAVPTKGLDATKATPMSKLIKFALSDAGQKDVTDTHYVAISAPLKTAGLKVADDVAAQATTASSSTTSTTAAGGATTTSSTPSTTSAAGPVTAFAVGSSSGTSAGSDPGGSGSSPTASGASSAAASPAVTVSAAVDPPTLPATGRAVVPTALIALILVMGGEIARRRARRSSSSVHPEFTELR
jgi:ABC-type phosphate transport system substrate-binding protein